MLRCVDACHVPHTLSTRCCFCFESEDNATIYLSDEDSALITLHMSRCMTPISSSSKRLRVMPRDTVLAEPPWKTRMFYMPAMYPAPSSCDPDNETDDTVVRPIHLLHLLQQLRGQPTAAAGQGISRMRHLLGIRAAKGP